MSARRFSLAEVLGYTLMVIAACSLALPQAWAQGHPRSRPVPSSVGSANVSRTASLSLPEAAPDGSSHYRFISFDVPGEVATEAYGINDSGLISGFYAPKPSLGRHGDNYRCRHTARVVPVAVIGCVDAVLAHGQPRGRKRCGC